MRQLGFIVNPSSGKGRSVEYARQLQVLAESKGWQTTTRISEPEYCADEIAAFLAPLDAVVLAGGDGTIMGLLDHLAASRTPLYALPGGNQSLFSSLFSMPRDPQVALACIEAGNAVEQFFGRVCGRAFFHMVSIGLDSLTVEAVVRRRRGTISNLKYLLPTLKAAWNYSNPYLTLSVDGEEVLTKESGYLVIAKSPAYACGLTPVPEARSAAQSLFIRFYPCNSVIWYLRVLPALVQRRGISSRGSRSFRGSKIRVHFGGNADFPIQADGELIGYGDFTVEVGGSIQVLISEQIGSRTSHVA